MANAAPKKSQKKSVRDDTDNPKLTLKDITTIRTFALTDYAGPFSSEYGESYLTQLTESNGKKWKLFLSTGNAEGEGSSAAGRAFKKALDEGKLEPVDMGGTLQLIFRPKPVGKEGNIMVDLRFGKSTVVAEASPF